MRLIDHTISPYTGAAAGPAESFGRIARQQPLISTAPSIAAVARFPAAPEPHADALNATALDSAAHLARARRVGDLVARVLHVAVAAVRGRIDAWRRSYERHLTVRTLSRLDARTLRDLGLDRSELLSAAYYLERGDYIARLHPVRAADALRLF